jgi:hypothetical protein
VGKPIGGWWARGVAVLLALLVLAVTLLWSLQRRLIYLP